MNDGLTLWMPPDGAEFEGVVERMFSEQALVVVANDTEQVLVSCLHWPMQFMNIGARVVVTHRTVQTRKGREFHTYPVRQVVMNPVSTIQAYVERIESLLEKALDQVEKETRNIVTEYELTTPATFDAKVAEELARLPWYAEGRAALAAAKHAQIRGDGRPKTTFRDALRIILNDSTPRTEHDVLEYFDVVDRNGAKHELAAMCTDGEIQFDGAHYARARKLT